MNRSQMPAAWFPAVRTGTGTDVFTQRLCDGLNQRGMRAEIAWLPLRAEYAPWTIHVPVPPAWASVVHVNTWLHPRFLPAYLPVVATLHHSIYDPTFVRTKGLSRRLYHRYWIRSIERRTMRRADIVVAVSRFACDIGRRYVRDRMMRVIYNGVDTETYRTPNAPRTAHRPFRLLYVGSWMQRKGVDLLVPIMRQLGSGFELRYTGGDADLRSRAHMPNYMHNIGRLGGDTAVVAAMQGADALLFPSRSEGFGLVAAEAMACGLPVIATRGSSLVELVQDGKTGLLCDESDVRAFADAARRLAEDPALCAAMGASARAFAVDKFSLETMLHAYQQVYVDLLRRAS